MFTQSLTVFCLLGLTSVASQSCTCELDVVVTYSSATQRPADTTAKSLETYINSLGAFDTLVFASARTAHSAHTGHSAHTAHTAHSGHSATVHSQHTPHTSHTPHTVHSTHTAPPTVHVPTIHAASAHAPPPPLPGTVHAAMSAHAPMPPAPILKGLRKAKPKTLSFSVSLYQNPCNPSDVGGLHDALTEEAVETLLGGDADVVSLLVSSDCGTCADEVAAVTSKCYTDGHLNQNDLAQACQEVNSAILCYTGDNGIPLETGEKQGCDIDFASLDGWIEFATAYCGSNVSVGDDTDTETD